VLCVVCYVICCVLDVVCYVCCMLCVMCCVLGVVCCVLSVVCCVLCCVMCVVPCIVCVLYTRPTTHNPPQCIPPKLHSPPSDPPICFSLSTRTKKNAHFLSFALHLDKQAVNTGTVLMNETNVSLAHGRKKIHDVQPIQWIQTSRRETKSGQETKNTPRANLDRDKDRR
jgi:hypothetical protein